jgi:hypothetical protein
MTKKQLYPYIVIRLKKNENSKFILSQHIALNNALEVRDTLRKQDDDNVDFFVYRLLDEQDTKP